MISNEELLEAALEKILRIRDDYVRFHGTPSYIYSEERTPNDLLKAIDDVIDTVSFNMTAEQYDAIRKRSCE